VISNQVVPPATIAPLPEASLEPKGPTWVQGVRGTTRQVGAVSG